MKPKIKDQSWIRLHHRERQILRVLTWEAQGRVCNICHLHCHGMNVQSDHIMPRSKNGKTTPSNIQATCLNCNEQKSNHHKLEDIPSYDTATLCTIHGWFFKKPKYCPICNEQTLSSSPLHDWMLEL